MWLKCDVSTLRCLITSISKQREQIYSDKMASITLGSTFMGKYSDFILLYPRTKNRSNRTRAVLHKFAKLRTLNET